MVLEMGAVERERVAFAGNAGEMGKSGLGLLVNGVLTLRRGLGF